MKKFLVITVMFLAYLVTSNCVMAHPPYLVKKGTITDTNNIIIIKEHLYGDGVITNDPVVFQLRNNNGRILAKSSIGSNIASFCHSIKFCLVVPYNTLSLFTTGFLLDTPAINLKEPIENYNFQYNEKALFEKYLKNKDEKRISSYAFGYPETSKTHFGFKKSYLITVLSPLIIIIDQAPILIMVLLMSSLLSWLNRLPSKPKNIKNRFFRYLACSSSTLIAITLSTSLILIVFFVASFIFTTPIFFIILAWLVSRAIEKARTLKT